MTETTTIVDYVREKTTRGECNCGRCFDRGNAPDPTGHVADMILFKVAAVGSPSADEFRRLTVEFPGDQCETNPLDGQEHSYLELGAWIGNQGVALQYMALGALLGVFKLLTPRTVLGSLINDAMVMQLAGQGMVCVQAGDR